MRKVFLMLALLVAATACQKKSEIKVINKVGSCSLSNVSFGDYRIGSSMIYGESATTEIKDKKHSFPKKHPIKFYMTSKGNTVLLETVEEYELTVNGTLEVLIENSTRVKIP